MIDKPTDTSKDECNPQWLFGRDPKAIEAQEARGQQELCSGRALPTKVEGISDEELIRLGFELGKVFEDDPIFRLARLPPGWRLIATDHIMWSDIVDNRDNIRARVFYKAAFYDRRAVLAWVRRKDDHD